MLKAKIKRNFREGGHVKCLARLRCISKGIRNSPHLPEPFKTSNVPSLDKYDEGIERYQVAYDAAINFDRVNIAIRNEIQDEVCEMAEALARYAEMELGNNPTAFLSMGFDVVGRSKSRSSSTQHQSEQE